jgi:hypothetical protein
MFLTSSEYSATIPWPIYHHYLGRNVLILLLPMEREAHNC